MNNNSFQLQLFTLAESRSTLPKSEQCNMLRALQLYGTLQSEMAIESIVSIVRCEDYSIDQVKSSVELALDLAELSRSFRNGLKVLIKPNLLSARPPEDAVTTHPAVIRAVGELARDASCEVTIGDSPPFAGENPGRYDRLCEATGVKALSTEINAQIVRFEERVATLKNPNGRFYKTFDIAQAVLDADLTVNIPKLKTHGLTFLTGAVKNLFGCVPGVRKGLFHVQAAEDREVFAQMLVDFLGAINPGVHVMDAVVGMEGEGPNAGQPKRIGFILASSDPVALDAVASFLVGIDPLSVGTTRLAYEQGLGCGDISRIEVRGEKVQDVVVRDFRQSSGRNDWTRIPAPIRKLLRRQLVAHPQVDISKCVGCGDCLRACPVRAISLGRHALIDLDKCIRCYCCHEVCNFSAINLRRGLVGMILSRFS
jgi:uncharacterized protein (DUF362 family)/Pyruvate/2-oxoacid:ferredoxin oxidoreductase delta subunit